MLTYSQAEAMMAKAPDRGYGARRKLQHNTYLVCRGADYAIRLHYTDVVTIHPDGTYTLSTGGWDTVTTKERLNNWSPARVGSERGTWVIWHRDDPRMPEKIQKCRSCKGTGRAWRDVWGVVDHYQTETHHVFYTERNGETYPGHAWWRPTPQPLRRGGQPVTGQPSMIAVVGQVSRWRGHGITGREQVDCWRCDGTGRRDYGSQSRHVVFYDGITVDSDGKVTDRNARRIPETAEEKAKREAAEKREADRQAREARKMQREAARRARERQAMLPALRDEWLAEHGLTASDDGTVNLYKAVRADGNSDNSRTVTGVSPYLPGNTVTAPDYAPTERCGAGLHFCADIESALGYDSRATRFMVCAVAVDGMIALSDKVKARTCTVLYEVARDGRRVRHTAWDDLPAGTATRPTSPECLRPA